MTLCKVNDMDIVTHAGAVGGVVIAAEHTQIFKLADGRL